MKPRHTARRFGTVAAIASVSALSALAFAGTAGALSIGSQVPDSALPISPDPTSGLTVTPGTPYSSGQTISVQVPPNSVLTPNTNVVLEECAAPNGVLPTLPSQCDSNTFSQDTIIPTSSGPNTGAFTYNAYQVYALPDLLIGDTADSAVTCGDSPATECVIGMFDDTESFTAPHLFSQTFYVVPSARDQATTPGPGDGTPEVPVAVGLPLAAAGIFGGITLRRRRSARSAA